MDHQILCAHFQPPQPLNMATYLDRVTQGRARPDMFMSVWVLDEVLRLVHARPSLPEQAALLHEMERRFVEHGRSHGWLEAPRVSSDESTADVVTTFMLKDMLGLSGAAPQDKFHAAFKSALKTAVKGHLNQKGKTSLKLLEVLLDLGSARSAAEVGRALSKLSVKELGAWLADKENAKWLSNSLLKAMPVNKVSRLRLVKLVAARLTWLEVSLSRLAWVSVWLTALDLLLTPERIADDATERRLTFLTAYGRLFARRSSQFGHLVRTCHGAEWELTLTPQAALGAAITQGH